MTAEEIVYDILEIKNAINDDRDIDEIWLIHKFNAHRSLQIIEEFKQSNEIRSMWLMRLYKQEVKKVTSADDPSITTTSIELGKVHLPNIVAIPNDAGFVRLTGSSGILTFDPISYDTLMLKINFKEDKMGEFGYYTQIGNDVFLWPYVREVQAIIIPEDPFDIQVIDPTTKVLRDFGITDDYPLDIDMCQKVIWEVLTKDLAYNDQQVKDIVNDSQNQLKVMRNGSNQEPPVN
jgi:hypothetical protein